MISLKSRFLNECVVALLMVPLILTLPPLPVAIAQDKPTAEVRISVKLITTDLDLKPVPRHALEIVPTDGASNIPREVVTSFSGEAVLRLAPGTYRVRSKNPVEFQGRRLRWDVAIEVLPATSNTVELSNDNATTGKGRQGTGGISLASQVFEASKNAVVTVETEVGHGSGFLVDSRGLFLTNAHVVEGSRFFALQFDEKTRYPAYLASSDPNEDVAVLLVNPKALGMATPLQLAPDSPDDPVAHIGDEIYAIGSPFSQRRIITAGIVSGIETGAIISDVMIDQGSSGGPLLNSANEVIGINTFGEGRGISGTVRIWKAIPVLEEARRRLSEMKLPPERALPPIPDTRFPPDAIKKIILSKDFRIADYLIRTKRFNVYVLTPPADTYWNFQAEIEASRGRKKRRKHDRVEAEDTFDPLARIRGWNDYVGGNRATIKVLVVPKTRATFGSSLAAGLTGVQSVTKYKYRADFDTLRLLRADTEIPFIRIGRSLNTALESTSTGHIKDAAYGGFAEFLPEAFAPSANGEQLILEIYNEKNPEKVTRAKISSKVQQRVWDDFSAMRDEMSSE